MTTCTTHPMPTSVKLYPQEHNELSQLPSSFWQLYSLQALWLGHNSLTHLPDTLDRLPGLALLHAPHNNLEAVPRSLLARGSSLLSLDLAHNQLRQLPPGFLRSLSRLTSLDLSHNQLCSCPQLQGPHATTQLFDADLAHEAAGGSPSNSPVILRTISMVLPRPRGPANPTLEDHEARGRGLQGNSHPSPCSLGVHPPALSTSNSEPDTVRLSAAEAVAATLASGCLNLRTPSTPSLAAVAQYQATGPAYRRMSSLRVQTNTSLVLELSTGARSPVQASPSALQVGTSCADHSVPATQALPASPSRICAHVRGAHGRAATSAVDDATSTHKGAMPLSTQALHPGWSQGAAPPSPPQQQDEHQALSKRRRAVLVPISPPQPFADVVQSALASPSPGFAVHSATSQATAADAAADAVTDAAFLAGWEDGHCQQALPELGFLSIAGNQLRHVPAWLPSRLRTLDLSKNLLSQVPEWLSTRMAQLQVGDGCLGTSALATAELIRWSQPAPRAQPPCKPFRGQSAAAGP
ncbi:hypothetical protein QJQ45_025323 [Haematococcus lacustris]|nr:hypothetical protein QJQ45_025323 [Haematococcus lacustris]